MSSVSEADIRSRMKLIKIKLKELKTTLSTVQKPLFSENYQAHIDCKTICQALKNPQNLADCERDCRVSKLTPDELFNLVDRYPNDKQFLKKHPNVLEMFTRHAISTNDVRDDDIYLIPDLYSTEVAIMAIPDDTWTTSMVMLQNHPDQQRRLVTLWKKSEPSFSKHALEERDAKLLRLGL